MSFGTKKISFYIVWKAILQKDWYDATGYWAGAPIRCDFCGRRIEYVSEYLEKVSNGMLITTCLEHETKEPFFYHETAILNELYFYIKSTIRFVRIFVREFPLNILSMLHNLIDVAIDKQFDRLGYK